MALDTTLNDGTVYTFSEVVSLYLRDLPNPEDIPAGVADKWAHMEDEAGYHWTVSDSTGEELAKRLHAAVGDDRQVPIVIEGSAGYVGPYDLFWNTGGDTPNGDYSLMDNTMWFSWTCPDNFVGYVEFDTMASIGQRAPGDLVYGWLDTVLAVWIDGEGFTFVAGNDDNYFDFPDTFGYNAGLVFTPTPGQAYLIALGLFSTTLHGDAHLHWGGYNGSPVVDYSEPRNGS